MKVNKIFNNQERMLSKERYYLKQNEFLKKPINIFCRGCGYKLGQMERLFTPTEWKEKNDCFECPECGRILKRKFELVWKK